MMNLEWHEAHKMPDNPTLEQRMEWHLDHRAHCDCRDIPDSIKQALAERGVALPQPPTH